jgi:hypothetical protein
LTAQFRKGLLFQTVDKKSSLFYSAFRHKAAMNQLCLLATTISENGQEQSFEQTNTCSECASLIKLIASIEDPAVIKQILTHLDKKAAIAAMARFPPCRAPPATGLFD